MPILGYLDDVVIVPLGILMVVKLVQPEIMAEHRAAAAVISKKPVSRAASIVIALVWMFSIGLAIWAGCAFLGSTSLVPASSP